jgi:hypothetical protein
MYRNMLKAAVATLLVCLLFFSSGCALLWLGAAGTGGYLIRKGEEGGEAKPNAPASSKVNEKKTSAY